MFLLLLLLHASLPVIPCNPASVNNDTQITVRCTPADAFVGWPSVYTAKLQATAGDAKCPDADYATATITRTDKPDLTVQGPDDTSVCVDASSKEFPFILRTTTQATIKITSLSSGGTVCKITTPDMEGDNLDFPLTGEC